MNEIEKLIRLSEQYFYDKNYQNSKKILKKLIKLDPTNTRANELLGYIYGNEEKFDEASQYLTSACQGRNYNTEALYYLGKIQALQKNYVQGINSLEKAIKKNGDFYEALFDLGSLCNAIGENQKAIEYYQRAMKFGRNKPELYFNLARIYHDQKKYEEAKNFYDKSLILRPNYAEAFLNKGIIFKKEKNYNEALENINKTIELNPRLAQGHSSLGHTLTELKNYEEALICFDKAIAIDSNYAEAWSNKGHVLTELKNYEEVLICFDKAIAIDSNYAGAWLNKGHALTELKNYEEALICFDKAIAIDSNYAEAWSNKGHALTELKNYEEALMCFDKAIKINPTMDWLEGEIKHTKMKICLWDNHEAEIKKISELVKQGKKINQPFAHLSITDDIYELKKVAEIFTKSKYQNVINKVDINNTKNEKIRIAYFSADFKEHPVSILTAEMFELHDKNLFEIYAFSYGPDDKGQMRKRIINAFNQFYDVSKISDLEIVTIARKLKIDIAIDLGGYTSKCRTEIFNNRVAPIQVSYIGFLGTMGNNKIDYLIADKTIITNEEKDAYTEKIIFLPSYQINDRKRKIADKKFTREELGLPKNSFIFCNFNNNYKLTPDIFNGWIEILKRTTDSSLFLYAENNMVVENLKNYALARNIDSNRLIFGNKISAENYLARYKICDLFLDTFPYNGGTTCSDAIWAGLPVVTLKGKSFASRYASSILNSAGQSMLIANSLSEYINLAINLAENPSKLKIIKKELENNRLTMPLFDSHLFTKNIEKAYIKMYERNQQNLPPDHITID